MSYRIETLGHFSTYGDSTKGDYLCTVAGDSRELALFHDSASSYDPPKVGDEFAGEIVKGKRGEWRLKRTPRQQAGGQSSSTGGGYQKSPDQQRSIVRQHSQEMALRFIAATGDAKDMNLTDPTVVGAYLSGTVRRLTDWFAADATAPPKSAPVSQSNGGEVPADMRELQPVAASKSDEDIPF